MDMEELLKNHSPEITPEISGDIEETGSGKKKIPKEPEDEIDLHGRRNAEDAMNDLDEFIIHATEQNYRKIRIISGKGIHSKDGKAKLPTRVKQYLDELQSFRIIQSYENKNGYFDIFFPS